MTADELERCSSFTSGNHGVRELQGGAVTQRIRCHSTRPPFHRASVMSRIACRSAEPFEDAKHLLPKGPSMFIGPSLESLGLADMNRIQKVAAIKLNGVLERVCRERPLESPEVTVDDCRIEGKITLSKKERVAMEVPSQCIKRLRERLPRARVVTLRPEEREQRVAGYRAITICREYGQQRQST